MNEWPRNIQRLVDEIDACIRSKADEALSLRSLARRFGYSEYHFSRKFRELSSLSFRDYLRWRRLAFALKRLRDDHAQCRRSDYDISLDELAECIGNTSLEEAVRQRELGRLINRFLGTVSRDQRDLFLRRYWFGDSIKDLSAAFHIPENTVSVRLSRIRGKLKAFLTQEGYYEK